MTEKKLYGKKIQAIICLLISTMIIAGLFANEPIYAKKSSKTDNKAGRIINVVYDDSGSMYRTKKKNVDTWCQAKYSMEVFAAMLGENDIMNVYYMSDYEKGTDSKPRLVLYGKDGSSTNVSKIHNEKTKAGNTPFNAVKKAYQDLSKSSGGEKWLVILTDGEFEDGKVKKEEVDNYLRGKKADINVMFLAIGADAAGITEKVKDNIYFVKADNNSQILKEITGICNRIYNSDKLDVNVSTKSFSFDVPMGELIVFAQGANVKIDGIKSEDGTVYKSSKLPVEVKYSECDATNYSNEPTRDLQGAIATFKDDFPVGNYIVNVSGAETIEIYYKPNVEIEVYLKDLNGNEISDPEQLEAGDYIINMGLVKTGTKEKVKESKLLGNIFYEAEIESNGENNGTVYKNGDQIYLPEGITYIDASATYLEYHNVETQREYHIFKNYGISFEILKNPEYVIGFEKFDNSDKIRIKATIDGREYTAEEWEKMAVPVVSIAEDPLREYEIESISIEKSETPGIYELFPVLKDNKPSPEAYSDCPYRLVYEQEFENGLWKGFVNGTVDFKETRFWDKLVTYKTISAPVISLKSDGFDKTQYYEIKADLDGREITPEEWAIMELPTVSLTGKKYEYEIGTPVIQATETPGVYRVYPTISNDNPSSEIYSDVEFNLSYNQSFKYETWSGNTDGNDFSIKFNDERSWYERNKSLVKKLIALGILFLIIFGYLPFVKHYLPRGLKTHPQILCIPEEPGEDEKKREGHIHKYFFSTILPYRAQRAKAQVLPNNISFVSPLELKALRGKYMTITNIKTYKDQENITINNKNVTDKTNNKFHSIKTSIKRSGWSYDCSLTK